MKVAQVQRWNWNFPSLNLRVILEHLASMLSSYTYNISILLQCTYLSQIFKSFTTKSYINPKFEDSIFGSGVYVKYKIFWRSWWDLEHCSTVFEVFVLKSLCYVQNLRYVQARAYRTNCPTKTPYALFVGILPLENWQWENQMQLAYQIFEP